MEITCNRCHQPIPDRSTFCPTCGLPQLVYSSEEGEKPAQADRWTDAVRDASQVEWKPALRAALIVAVPAGILSCGFTPLGLLGLFWIAAAAAWAVSIYVRRQRSPWITMGAGARIGLVTGLMAGWLAFCATGIAFYSMRFFMHQGGTFDEAWTSKVNESFSRQFQSADPQAVTIVRSLFLSPEGRAGMVLIWLLLLEVGLLVFAAAGGALGARMMARSRGPEA
ncbi:zinc ribbon domain-containing protein [Occallatibacter riparius]|uniref:Zinc ribbon domain-containing protein n=1 Tax=Occallatibacter riparius TaxID=1002689 RepID=A0A9J7BU36_9BACT|nr:zinc ribbon domain-containing protein [Occallatibacter riparius]UWZ86159.1 zinc ribbon domain-containing protein [Occallatibacter riparius]